MSDGTEQTPGIERFAVRYKYTWGMIGAIVALLTLVGGSIAGLIAISDAIMPVFPVIAHLLLPIVYLAAGGVVIYVLKRFQRMPPLTGMIALGIVMSFVVFATMGYDWAAYLTTAEVPSEKTEATQDGVWFFVVRQVLLVAALVAWSIEIEFAIVSPLNVLLTVVRTMFDISERHDEVEKLQLQRLESLMSIPRIDRVPIIKRDSQLTEQQKDLFENCPEVLASEESKLILHHTAKDRRGMLNVVPSVQDGVSFVANARDLTPDNKARTVAAWREALKHLVAAGLMEEINEQHYRITKAGYSFADALSKRDIDV